MLIILIYLDEMIDDIDRNIQCWIDDAVIENLHQIRKEEAKNQRRIHEEEEENQHLMEAQCLLDESKERCRQEAIQMEADLQVVMDEEECNCIKAAWRAHLREVAYQMRDLSVTNDLPPQMQLQCIVKIPIFVAFSNAMNLQEILPVPSLRRDVVPGLHARSHSASLSLWRSGQTWIISWPDYAGLQGLIRILWPALHVSTVCRPSPTGHQTRTTSPHILTGLDFTHPEPASRPLISRYIFSSFTVWRSMHLCSQILCLALIIPLLLLAP